MSLLAFALAGQIRAADPLPQFDVHFAVITRNPGAHRVATREQLEKEVEILNAHFVSEQRHAVVVFKLKSVALYGEIKDSACELVGLGDSAQNFDSGLADRAFNACAEPLVRDPHAINFYVYDAYAGATGFADATGHGRRNSNRPYVFLDWKRLNHAGQAPEEHEMGHAFGLGHECVPGATPRTSTNIMASAECGKGSGGMRDLGFNARQVESILKYAALITERLRPARP
jgi:hypothetical protein